MRGDIAWGHCVGTLPNARQTRAKGRRRMTKGWSWRRRSPGGPADLGGATQVPRRCVRRRPPPQPAQAAGRPGWSLYWQRGFLPGFCRFSRDFRPHSPVPRFSPRSDCALFPDHGRPHVPREAPIQEAVVVWFKGENIMFVASANGRFHGQRSVGVQYRKMGVEPGVADLLVLEVGYDGKPGLAIELKCEGNRLQASQEAWLQRVRSKGWRTAVVYGSSPDDGLAKVKECVLFHINGPAGTSEERPIICE